MAKKSEMEPWVEPPWVEDTDWENDPKEPIIRWRFNEKGEVEEIYLPPTLYNLTHPEENEKVAQSNRHARTLARLDDILRRRLEDRPGVGVFNDLMIYWDDPSVPKLSPDLSVFFDLKRPAEEYGESFSVVQEGIRPSLIFEVVSATYKDHLEKDYTVNREYFQRLGIRELVLVEPVTKGSPRIRRLLALRLDPAGVYQEIEAVDGRYFLETVGLTVHADGDRVILCDAKTGERLLAADELDEARQDAEERAEDTLKQLLYERHTAEVRQAEAEARQAALLAEIERLKRSKIN